MKLKALLKNSHPSPEGGYTIIESLVAMIMVAALMVAVAPVIAFSVGTRVQARRIELAAQAARSYIDTVRSGQLDPPEGFAGDDEITANAFTECSPRNATTNKLQYCTNPIISVNNGQFFCVDNDGDEKCTPDSMTDMMVEGAIILPSGTLTASQSQYITQMGTANSTQKSELGYSLRVRVYRASAFKSSVKLPYEGGAASTVNNAGLSSRYSSGGEEKERPLYRGTTEIAPSDNSFKNLRDRLGRD